MLAGEVEQRPLSGMRHTPTPQRLRHFGSIEPQDRRYPLQRLGAPNGRRVSGSRRADGDERVRRTRVLGGLSIDVLAVRNAYDENEQLIVSN
jgi:hypothetical protein